MNKNRKIWTLSFGLITALVIVLSQVFWFQAQDFGSNKAKSEQSADAASEDGAHISLPSSSLPSSSSSVVVGQELSFIHEIIFEKETAHDYSGEISLAVGKFFHTLFRVIIAPNAP